MKDTSYITLESDTGFSVDILTLGGIIVRIMAKDYKGTRQNVVLNYKNFEDYKNNVLYLGCITGPVAGRTKNGQLKVGENTIQLDTSSHPNSLHGCLDGLQLIQWSIKSQTNNQVVLTYQSKKFNSDISYTVTYTADAETLSIEYAVTTTEPIYLSLTNHSYFNLTGNFNMQISNHDLKINATHFAKLDPENLPIELLPVTKTALDFRNGKPIQNALSSGCEEIEMASGIDHPFKLIKSSPVIELRDPISRRLMRVETTQPYVIVYTGNFLNTSKSSSGVVYGQHTGICLETQDLPNVPNNHLDQVHYVTPYNPYHHISTYSFSVF